MGQQQILFVILVVCIIGISVSVGVISLVGRTMPDDRALVEQDLRTIALKAQDCVATSAGKSEGDEMSFSRLSRMPDALDRLGCPSSNAHGDFFVKKSDNPACMQIVGVGTEAGRDRRHPLRLMITVWAGRVSLVAMN